MEKTVTLYGIKACDTCRKAKKELLAAGYQVTFRDIRDEPLTRAEIEDFHGAFGEALLNKKSTTWRGLNEAERSQAPQSLLAAHPTLMKRPVVAEENEAPSLGWKADVAQKYLGAK